jgi:hypothetical protein
MAWLVGPLLVLWSVSTAIDYDIAKRFVNLAYDRALLEAALDIGRQVRVINDRIYLDLPEVALQMLQTRESGRLYYLVTGPTDEFISGGPTGCATTTRNSAARKYAPWRCARPCPRGRAGGRCRFTSPSASRRATSLRARSSCAWCCRRGY